MQWMCFFTQWKRKESFCFLMFSRRKLEVQHWANIRSFNIFWYKWFLFCQKMMHFMWNLFISNRFSEKWKLATCNILSQKQIVDFIITKCTHKMSTNICIFWSVIIVIAKMQFVCSHNKRHSWWRVLFYLHRIRILS